MISRYLHYLLTFVELTLSVSNAGRHYSLCTVDVLLDGHNYNNPWEGLGEGGQSWFQGRPTTASAGRATTCLHHIKPCRQCQESRRQGTGPAHVDHNQLTFLCYLR